MRNLRITSNFAHKITSIRHLRIIFLNFGSASNCLTDVIKIFEDDGCLSGNIEDNIKVGLTTSFI